MSLHSTLMAGAGIPMLVDCQGEEFSYVPADGTAAVELTGLVGAERKVEKRTGQGRRVVRERTFGITTEVASRFGGVAAVNLKATLKYGDLEYAIAESKGEISGFITLVGQRTSVADHASGYQE